MADLGVPSRFAVLLDEGTKKVKKTVTATPKTTDTKEKLKRKKSAANNTKTEAGNRKKGGKQTTNVVVNEAKVLPVGLNFKTEKKTPKAATKQKETEKLIKSDKQENEFKKKYEEAEAREFLQNLEEAILESKLNYEENKEYYESLKQTAKVNEVAARKKKRTKKPKAEEPLVNGINSKGTKTSTSSVDDEVPEEPTVTKKEKKQKKLAPNVKVPERDTTDVRLLQYRAELEEKDEQIVKLVSEANQMKEEIGNLKKVNMKFCNILEKVKDKVESILMVEELVKVKDELTQEVISLHASLEQERSKVHSLQLQLRAQGGRKDSK